MFDDKKAKTAKDFRINIWQREYGATWLSFEHKKIKEFSKVKPNQKVTISGYVKWITNKAFALIPTPITNQIYLLCVNLTEKRPIENSYITISGFTKFDFLRRNNQTENSTLYEGTLVTQVHGWKNANPQTEIPKTYLDYNDFKTGLTFRVEGLEPKLRDFLAFTAISTPAFCDNAGGINLTLYDSTKLGLPRKVAREIARAIPEGISDLNTINTEFGRFAMRYKYAYVMENADKPLSKETEDLLVHKTSRFMPGCSEASISLFSSKEKPRTIEDPPCSLSDIPTVIPEGTSINRSRQPVDPFDAFAFMAANHLKTPIISDLSKSQSIIVNNLEKLTDSYGLDPKHLNRYGFLNANYNARPTSIIRDCLAFARAQDINKVDSDLVSKVFDDFFKWNFEYVYDVWEDLLTQPLIGGEQLASLRVKYREIVRIIRKYQSTGLIGVNKEDILREAKTSPLETQQLLDQCLKTGIIYEPIQGFYKLTKDLA